MPRRTPQKKPSYMIESVDSAFRLVQLLRDGGSMRVKDAAAELDVAPSTAHRLLAMLVYRGFAIQDESRVYVPGPSIGAGPVRVPWTRMLRDVARPHLELLSSRLEETTNLMVRVGSRVRFLASVEASNLLRIGDRQGAVLPAREASGGKALLAALDVDALNRMYRSAGARFAGDGLSDQEFEHLANELHGVRQAGYAVNDEESESGIGAVGLSLSGASDRPIAAFSVAVPISRFRRLLEPGPLELLRTTRSEIEHDLAAAGVDGREPEPEPLR